MKLTTGILAVAMMTGAAWAQSLDAGDDQSNAAQRTAVAPTQGAQPTKPTPGAPAPAVKPAAIPGAKPAGRDYASQFRTAEIGGGSRQGGGQAVLEFGGESEQPARSGKGTPQRG